MITLVDLLFDILMTYSQGSPLRTQRCSRCSTGRDKPEFVSSAYAEMFPVGRLRYRELICLLCVRRDVPPIDGGSNWSRSSPLRTQRCSSACSPCAPGRSVSSAYAEMFRLLDDGYSVDNRFLCTTQRYSLDDRAHDGIRRASSAHAEIFRLARRRACVKSRFLCVRRDIPCTLAALKHCT